MGASIWKSIVKMSVHFNHIYRSVNGNAGLGRLRWEERVKTLFSSGTRACEIVASGNIAQLMLAHRRLLIVYFNQYLE